jgi:hypothetical protein
MANSILSTSGRGIPREPEQDPKAAEDKRVFMYRMGEGGEVESQLFEDAKDVPSGEGWVDNPAKCHKKQQPAKKQAAHD